MNETTPALPTTGLCPCGTPAVAVLTARGGRSYPYRAVTTCAACEPAHHRWTATAGPVQRRALTATQEPTTLF